MDAIDCLCNCVLVKRSRLKGPSNTPVKQVTMAQHIKACDAQNTKTHTNLQNALRCAHTRDCLKLDLGDMPRPEQTAGRHQSNRSTLQDCIMQSKTMRNARLHHAGVQLHAESVPDNAQNPHWRILGWLQHAYTQTTARSSAAAVLGGM
jgi:hypothetical protein